MGQSLSNIIIHIVFSTKERHPWIQDREVRENLHAYLSGIAKRQKCPAIIIGGVADHVHLLCRMDRDITIAKLIQELKRSSSLWIKTQGPNYSSFGWQNGYGAFSLHESLIEPSRKYITEQEEHHRSMTFQEEFLKILKKAKVDFDPRYIWD